jgi:hypothetical protein
MEKEMKRWIPLLATIIFFTVTYLLDIWSTSLFLGSPNCVEGNPLFAPFSKSPLLLGQMYITGWFLFIGSSGYLYLLNKRLGGHWLIEIGWYWLLWVSGFQHLSATAHNISMLGICWA